MISEEARPLLEQNKSFQNGVQFAWDATSIKSWEKCPRYYYYAHIEGWQTRTLNEHLRFGLHYATALEHYHKHIASGDNVDEALLKVVREAMEDTWDRECLKCKGAGSILEHPADQPFSQSLAAMDTCPKCAGSGADEGRPWTSLDTVKNRGNLIRTIIWYVEQFRDDPAKVVILSDGRPAVEYSFSLPVDNGLIFCGHIDRLVDYSDNIYVQDQKTTKTTISAQYFRQYSPDTQMSMYAFAGRMVYGNPIKGVMIDAAQIAVGFSRFERGFTFRGPGTLEEWYDVTLAHIEDAQRATREQYFPMNTTSCHQYGGCTFREICSRSPSVRKNFLEGNFERTRLWDPLERR